MGIVETVTANFVQRVSQQTFQRILNQTTIVNISPRNYWLLLLFCTSNWLLLLFLHGKLATFTFPLFCNWQIGYFRFSCFLTWQIGYFFFSWVFHKWNIGYFYFSCLFACSWTVLLFYDSGHILTNQETNGVVRNMSCSKLEDIVLSKHPMTAVLFNPTQRTPPNLPIPDPMSLPELINKSRILCHKLVLINYRRF